MAATLTDDEKQIIIDYARRKFAEERYPLSPALRPVREALEKLEPTPEPRRPAKPHVPSTLLQKRRG